MALNKGGQLSIEASPVSGSSEKLCSEGCYLKEYIKSISRVILYLGYAYLG